MDHFSPAFIVRLKIERLQDRSHLTPTQVRRKQQPTKFSTTHAKTFFTILLFLLRVRVLPGRKDMNTSGVEVCTNISIPPV